MIYSKSAQYFSFVLTNQDAKWTFGFCRIAAGTEKALVIISCLPWHELFFAMLKHLEELVFESTVSSNSADLNNFLEAVYSKNVPSPGKTLHVLYKKSIWKTCTEVFTFQCPIENTLPSIPENVSNYFHKS